MDFEWLMKMELMILFFSWLTLSSLAEVLHPENHKKYFWRYFCIKVAISIAIALKNPSLAIADFFISFVSVFGIIIIKDKKKRTDGISSNYNVIQTLPNNLSSKSSKVSDPNVHDSKKPLSDEEQEELKNKIYNRFQESGMDEQTINERFNQINEFLDGVKNSSEGYSSLTASPEDNDSITDDYYDGIPDLSELYPDYQEEKFDYEKDSLFINRSINGIGNFMDEYIKAKVNDVTALHPKNIKQRTIARIIFSIITFLICTYICLYHENFILCGILEFIAIMVFRTSMKNMNLLNCIKKEIMARPDDNMNYIIESMKQQALVKRKEISSIFVPFTIVLCCLLFLKPHIIYEKNDTGYSVRYYTLAIINNSKVILPDEHKGEKVTEIRGKTFYNMFMIREVKLPKYITEIRGNTFENSGLVKIEIPEGVTRIGGHAFYGCARLKSVSIPSSMQEIGSSAFRRCSSLKYVKIPYSTYVNEKAFKESPTRIEGYEANGK